MADVGWIKIYRCLTEKAIWTCSTPEHCKILITLLMMANSETKQWVWQGKQFEANPGQFVTSADSIIKKCGKGITRQNVRSALEKFKKLDFLTYETTKTGMLITIVNWDTYQDKPKQTNQDSNQEPTNDQPTTNHQPLTRIIRIIRIMRSIYIRKFSNRFGLNIPKVDTKEVSHRLLKTLPL
ncbi:MAG: hypothetical protein H6Q72_4776 [Firmicutes bacterium]|nr:hypothetical protein [Bacillota bacterium]